MSYELQATSYKLQVVNRKPPLGRLCKKSYFHGILVISTVGRNLLKATVRFLPTVEMTAACLALLCGLYEVHLRNLRETTTGNSKNNYQNITS